jgi:3-oxoacyl-(acyl-carrier-protein) synthase
LSHQRVVVTGLGAVTPIGVTKDDYWQNLLVGRSGAGHVEFPEQDMAQYRTRIAAPVKGFAPDDYLPRDRKTRYLGKPTFFGRQAYQIPISSTKSMTGHLLGAAGGIEFIATVMATRNGLIPPTINYEFPDPECDLDYVLDEMREAPIESAMSISLGFGGFNCALVIRRYEPQ